MFDATAPSNNLSTLKCLNRIIRQANLRSCDKSGRRVVDFNVTEHPTAEWAAQLIIKAFPFDTVPKYLLRDHNGIYRLDFQQRVASMGIEQVLTTPGSPWQNVYVERITGSIHREHFSCIIIFNELHVHRILRCYLPYYNDCRARLSLDKDTPEPREFESRNMGEVIARPRLVAFITGTRKGLHNFLLQHLRDEFL